MEPITMIAAAGWATALVTGYKAVQWRYRAILVGNRLFTSVDVLATVVKYCRANKGVNITFTDDAVLIDGVPVHTRGAKKV